MSSSGGCRGGSGGEGARVSIPKEVRSTIHNIREITGKQHSDEDVYAMLEACSMDPNETTQKLLYLDTFHEVKSKRERRREISIRSPESKLMTDGPGRATKGNRFPRSNHVYSGGGKIAPQWEKVGNSVERGQLSSTSTPQKGKIITPFHISRASTPLQNGPYRLSNGSSSQGRMPSSSTGGDKVPLVTSNGETKDESSKIGSDSVAGELQGIAGAAENQSVSSTIIPESGFPDLQSVTNSLEQKSQTQPLNSGNPHLAKSLKIQKTPGSQGLLTPSSADQVSFTPKALLVKETSFVEETSDSVKVAASKVSEFTLKASPSSLHVPESRAHDGKPVTFPNHFKVSGALKNGLTFGSFDTGFGAKADISNGITSDDKSSFGADTSAGSDVTILEPFPSQIEGLSEKHEDSSLALKKDQKTLENHVSVDNGLSYDQGNFNLISEVPQNHIIQEVQATGFSLVPSILGRQVQPEVLDVQARDSLQNGNASTTSSSSPTLVPSLQSSITVSPQPIPVFRQPYPLNYFPYGHYIPPFYMPAVPQLINPNGFTQHPTPGSLYLPPAIAAQGMGIKYPFPSFKQGSNTTPMGIPSAYGPYGAAALGFNPGQGMTSGNTSSNEEMSSQLKENHTHSTVAPPSEAPTVWVPPLLGQDLTSLQVNSLYNLPQGPHGAFSHAQVGLVSFGMHQPAQNMVGASNVHPLLQPSPPGTMDSAGPPSGTYQHPQHSQMNWTTNF